MAHELYVFFKDENLPTRDQWQASLDSHNAGLVLGNFDPREHVGDVPVILDGEKSSVQIFEGHISDLTDLDTDRLAGRDRYLMFELSAEPIEIQAAVLAAAALAMSASGLFFDPQANQYSEGAQVFGVIERAESGDAPSSRNESRTPRPSRRCLRCRVVCPPHRARCRTCGTPITESSPIVELPTPKGRKSWWKFW